MAPLRGEVGEGGQRRWERLLLKSPQGDGQAGNGRAAQGRRNEDREELDAVREKMQRSAFRAESMESRREQDGVTCKGRELRGGTGLDASSANAYSVTPGFGRLIQAAQDCRN